MNDNDFLFENLRKKAEEKLLNDPHNSYNTIDNENVQQIIHELQVHQVELEMQNQELLNSTSEIEKIKQKYTNLFEFAPIGYFNIDASGEITQVNLAGAKILEFERKRILNNRFQSFVHPEYARIFYDFMISAFKTQEKQSCELLLISKSKKEVYVQVESIVFFDTVTNLQYCLTTVLDITERRNASQALLKAQMRLEHRVKERTDSLEKANLALKMEMEERLNIEKELQLKHNLLQGVIEGSSDAIFVKDENGNYILANTASCKFINKSQEEILGKNDFHIFPKEIAIELMKLNKKVVRTGRTVKHECLLPHSFEEKVYFITLSPYKDEEGNTIGVIGIAHDMTELRTVERERMHMMHMLENSLNEIYLINSETLQFDYVNRGACHNLGYSSEEMKKKSATDIIKHYDREEFLQLLEPLYSGAKEKITFYCEHVRADGTKYPVEKHLQILEKGSKKYILGITINIEERKKVEKALEEYAEDCRLNQLLMEAKAEDMVELNEKLLQSEKELKELNANKDKFLYIMAHDLKSPFNGLLGSSQFLKDHYDTMEYKDIKTFIHNINMLAINFKYIIDDLLCWSSLQHGTMPFNPVELNIHEHINILLPLLKENAQQKEIKIIHDEIDDVIVFADHTMINSVLQNLISNAIKFTHPKGTVAINYEDKGKDILVKISDNGIGMDDKTINKIFKIHKHHSTKGTADERGTGLGLILSKEFIEKHNGNLWVESEKGVGTTFCFTLPKFTGQES